MATENSLVVVCWVDTWCVPGRPHYTELKCDLATITQQIQLRRYNLNMEKYALPAHHCIADHLV